LERRAFEQSVFRDYDGWLVKPLRMRSLFACLAAPANRRMEAVAGPAADDGPDLDGCRFLLAEDNDINALIVSRHLEKLGADVLRVGDGQAALEAARQAISGTAPPFNAIILDIRMPGMDGLEVAQQIRRAERALGRPPGRLIALSADAYDADCEAANAAGIDEFLTKPVEFARLRRALTLTHAGRSGARV
jgi:CheY-like chemotaxis protein